jgi:ATP-binding cassette, subfamily B, multidrug efflux pump
MRELRTLLPYLRAHRTTLLVGLMLVLVSNYFNTLGPRYLERGIDALAGGAAMDRVRSQALWLVGVALLGGFARYGMRELLNSASRRVEYDVRDALYRHVQTMSPEFYDRYPTGDVMARTTNDLLAVRMVAGPAVMYLVDTLIRTCLVLPRMIAISGRLALLALLPLAGLPIAMFVLGGIIHRRTEAIQAGFSDLTEHVRENLAGVRIVRAYRQEAAELAEFRRRSEEYVARNMRLAQAQGLFNPLLSLLGGLGAVAVLWLGGRLVMAGAVSVGAFVAFGVYLGMLVWPMIAIGWAINLIQRGAASMGRINQLFAERAAVRDPERPVPLPPAGKAGAGGARRLTFEGVWFRYPNAPERGWVLEDVSLDLPAGRSLAVVGATGAGKSTLVDLIVRAYDPDRGRILLDGVDLRDLALADLRRAIALVPQETFLFSETLRDNVLLGAPDDGRLEASAEIAQLAEALPALPAGWDTLLGERGVNLSGGQKQRAATARALTQQPGLFVLDDALSAVDAQTEARILPRLRDALAGRTSVIVSHRMAAVRGADEILVLDGGRVVERGTHAALLAAGGRYWELLRRQQLEEELEEAEEVVGEGNAGRD